MNLDTIIDSLIEMVDINYSIWKDEHSLIKKGNLIKIEL